MSGIMENFRKIRDYGRLKNRERNLENEVIRATVDDTNFYKEYGAFVDGLQKKLDYLLDDEGYKVVVFRPKDVTKAKYFRAIMDDDQFNTNYIIEKTVGGEFSFELRDMYDFVE